MGELDAADLILPEDLAGLIKPELLPGEVVRWSARSEPRQDRSAWVGPAQVLAWSLGAVPATALGLVAIAQPGEPWTRYQGPLLFGTVVAGIVGIFAAVIGVAGLIGAFAGIRGGGRRPFYALTDRRAIVWSPEHGSPGMTVQSFPRTLISAGLIRRTEFPDGSGSVFFCEPFADGPGFVGVADVRRVEWLLRDLVGARIDPPDDAPRP